MNVNNFSHRWTGKKSPKPRRHSEIEKSVTRELSGQIVNCRILIWKTTTTTKIDREWDKHTYNFVSDFDEFVIRTPSSFRSHMYIGWFWLLSWLLLPHRFFARYLSNCGWPELDGTSLANWFTWCRDTTITLTTTKNNNKNTQKTIEFLLRLFRIISAAQ